jgi:hypothetical protein
VQNDDVDPKTMGYGLREVWVKRESTVTRSVAAVIDLDKAPS